MKFWSRFTCDHRYKSIRFWYSGIFGLQLWSHQDIQCIKCGRTKTITSPQNLDDEGKLIK